MAIQIPKVHILHYMLPVLHKGSNTTDVTKSFCSIYINVLPVCTNVVLKVQIQ